MPALNPSFFHGTFLPEGLAGLLVSVRAGRLPRKSACLLGSQESILVMLSHVSLQRWRDIVPFRQREFARRKFR